MMEFVFFFSVTIFGLCSRFYSSRLEVSTTALRTSGRNHLNGAIKTIKWVIGFSCCPWSVFINSTAEKKKKKLF